MARTIRKSGMKQVPLSEIKDGWAIFELTLRAPRRIVSFIRYERPQVASSRHLRSGAPDARKRPNAVSEACANRAENASRDSTPQQDDYRHFRQRSARRTVRSSESPFSAHFQWKNAVDSKTIESDALIELDEIELAEVAGGTSNPSRPAPPPAPPIPIPYPNFTNTF